MSNWDSSYPLIHFKVSCLSTIYGSNLKTHSTSLHLTPSKHTFRVKHELLMLNFILIFFTLFLLLLFAQSSTRLCMYERQGVAGDGKKEWEMKHLKWSKRWKDIVEAFNSINYIRAAANVSGKLSLQNNDVARSRRCLNIFFSSFSCPKKSWWHQVESIRHRWLIFYDFFII